MKVCKKGKIMPNSSGKVHGFTWLRTILSWMIVVWHGHFLGVSQAMTEQSHYTPSILDIFHMNIVQLGVPLFLLISLFLFIRKYDTGQLPPKYTFTRILHFLLIYLAWRSVYFCFGIGNLWISERGILRNIYHLVFGGDTVLYFFVELIWLTALTAVLSYLLNYLETRAKILLFSSLLGLSLIITSCLYILPLGIRIESLRYFSPIGFLPYLFAAQLLYILNRDFCVNKLIIIMSFLSIALIAIDWMLLPSAIYLKNGIGAAITGYGRVSLVCTASTFFLLFLKVQSPPPVIINNLSNISLYVFVIHPIAIKICNAYTRCVYILLVCLITLICSELLFWIMNRIHKRS